MEAHAEAAAVWRVFEGFDLAYLFGDACEHSRFFFLISISAAFLGAQAGLPMPRTHRENILGPRNRGRRVLLLNFAALGILRTSAMEIAPLGRRLCP